MDAFLSCFRMAWQTGNAVEIRHEIELRHLFCDVGNGLLDEPRRDIEIKSCVFSLQDIIISHGEHIAFDDMDISSVGVQ